MFDIKQRLHQQIRNKAISRAETRILLAGKKPEQFSEEELEIIVKEEEESIKSSFKEKGLMGLAALLGLSFWA
ncbi:hypothetical protein [Saliniradius amylolyticus]|nr:hypothetical protein [Saliniradius amylolyticus]